MTLPVVKVEIAFSTQPNDPSPNYVDVTSYVRNVEGNVSITRGRQDRYDTVQPSKVGFTLLNLDGRFTPGNVSSPYYPNVKKGRKVRVSVTYGGTTYRRFTGYVDEWPVTWADASGTVADAQVTASSRMALLGRQATLPAITSIEYFKDNPVAYYPLNDESGSLAAGNIAATVQPAMAITPFGGGATSNITFGSGGGASTDTMSGATYTRSSSTSGAYLSANINGIISATVISAEAVVTASATQEMGILQLDFGRSWLIMGTDASGHLTATFSSSALGAITATSSRVITDGKPHHCSVMATNGTGTLFLEIDGIGDGSSLPFAASPYTFTRFIIGGGVLNSAFSGSIAHAAAYASGIDAGLHGNAAANGFSGERSDQRVSRLALYAGVPLAEIDTSEVGLSTSVAAQDTTGQTPLQLMQNITATEDGVLFDTGAGKLTFQARSHRYNAATVLTLRAAGQDLLPSFEPRLNDQDLVNDVTASRPGGVSVHVADSASIGDYGVYHDDLSLLTTSDNEVFDAASWKVYVNSVPQVNVAVAEVELAALTPSQVTAVLGREIGDRITLASLPKQAPASSMDFFIEGVTETIADGSHTVSFNLSNANQSGVWQLDSSVYSVLDTSTRLAY